MSAVLTYKGHTVPHITAWSSEHLKQPPVVRSAGGVTFADIAFAGFPHRDSAGVLWQPWALRQGDGMPEFGRVHGPRQRRAMRRRLCQVCGGPADENEQGTLWLLENHVTAPGWPEREVTTHPPVCASCVPLVRSQCPHMQDAVTVRVGRAAVDGIYGLLYAAGLGGPVPGEAKVVFAGDPRVKWMVGAQLAATLCNVTVVDRPEPVTEEPVVRAGAHR
ncbi:hypothetical protein [Streptomyces gibsoniae]|uniref:Phage protein n=1 Tax=Streptomyces gibsoniae TaxID=3075529 RepID=A0ABU2TW39_9ACTN|nr:hypothetical protein [Streptomyces sp. DSM 41699]MDT0465129.1 hypothetical protein [Streptomyces sp. DSM 41699]